MSPGDSPAAFDELASGYDETFTSTVLGRRLRAAVWRRLDACFAPGGRVLELGCGTGEDAVYLAGRGVDVVALDRSAAMVEAARRKVERAALADRVRLLRLSIEEWCAAPEAAGGRFDGALSDFGALNCVADLGGVARALSASVRSGGRAVLVVMGPFVPWEWAWFLARGRPRAAFRRLAPGGAAWRGVTVRYPRIATVRRAFQPAFEARRVSALGAFLPPSYAGAWAARRPRLLARLERLERRFETWPPLPALSDHYLLELERR
jgi:SAM-dependent methyltransferase